MNKRLSPLGVRLKVAFLYNSIQFYTMCRGSVEVGSILGESGLFNCLDFFCRM